MKTVEETNRFSKEFIKTIKRGKKPQKLFEIVDCLKNGVDLPARCRPHKLSGSYDGYWECHIEPDWLLVYEFDEEAVTLYRTGSHSDLFR